MSATFPNDMGNCCITSYVLPSQQLCEPAWTEHTLFVMKYWWFTATGIQVQPCRWKTTAQKVLLSTLPLKVDTTSRKSRQMYGEMFSPNDAYTYLHVSG